LIRIQASLPNRTGRRLTREQGYALGAQWWDPDSRLFLSEARWIDLDHPVEPGALIPIDSSLLAPTGSGRYQLMISVVHPKHGWFYLSGQPVLTQTLTVADTGIHTEPIEQVSWRRWVRRGRWRRLLRLPLEPPSILWRNRKLLATLAARDLRTRYRGSVLEAGWAILNPLLLMGTYVFVFGFVLQARFPGETSSTGYLLSFLAGLVPWLGFNEGVARAPFSLLENRNIVKKLVFPVEILPLVPLASGLVTQGVALLILLIGFVATRGWPPATALFLAPLLVMQLLWSIGLAWFLSGTGVFLRDLGQIIGFLLTLLFFLSPICYPETALPEWSRPALSASPVYFWVIAYRTVLLDGRLPDLGAYAILLGSGILITWIGYVWFRRLRGQFADAL
jgi:lipopolysaccharide transport system permease protein